MTRILVIDNYDSFVYTIVGYLNQLGAETVVVRNDAVPPVAERAGFDGVLVSPGPGTPADAGAEHAGHPRLRGRRHCRCSGCASATRRSVRCSAARSRTRPSSCTARPARSSTRARACSPGCPTRSPRRGTTRSRSSNDTVSDELEVTRDRRTASSWACSTVTLPLHGVQFHPESVLTEGGHRLLANWLEICGDDQAVARSEGLHPLVRL